MRPSAQVLQPLVVPCLALFNTVPSAHLHLYSHTNNPRIALPLSLLMALAYLVAPVFALAECGTSDATAPATPSLAAQCPRAQNNHRAAAAAAASSSSTRRLRNKGSAIPRAYWNACVALWLISAAGYALLVLMAARVWRGMRRLERGIGLPPPSATQQQQQQQGGAEGTVEATAARHRPARAATGRSSS